jgi:hypothetical protein
MPCAFRPPYGEYDPTTLRLAQQRRMGVWLWSVDTLDWMVKGRGSSYSVQRIIWLAEQGGALLHPIVLMHDGRQGNPATVTALPAIIRFFRSHGYHFIALLPCGSRLWLLKVVLWPPRLATNPEETGWRPSYGRRTGVPVPGGCCNGRGMRIKIHDNAEPQSW